MLGLRCKEGLEEQTLDPLGPGLFQKSELFIRNGDEACRAKGCGLWWKFGSDGSIVNYLVGEGWAEQGGCDKAGSLDASSAHLWGEKSDALSQKWRVVSNNVVLMKASGSSTQMWSPVFLDPGYELALRPGFPGTAYDSNGESCLTSTRDHELAKSAMRSCDSSMSLLVGSQASLGRLTVIADLINKHGPDRMPGFCCMDDVSEVVIQEAD
jgi:hypothetical protein